METVIRVSDVSWRRGQRKILNHVNWEVKRGEHWAMVGVNGCGKTTLLNLVNGYIWPTSGEVEVLGYEYGRVNIPELRRRIGWVSSAMTEKIEQSQAQQTTMDIVISGKYASVGMWKETYDEDHSEACELLREFHIESLAETAFQSLSQGQKQRVLIARAWMAKPDLLILDEPCTGLDMKARENLLQSIDALGGKPDCPTLIFVTHHVEEILPLFNKCLVLKDGGVLACGNKEDIMDDAVLSHAFDVDVAVSWSSGRPWIQVKDQVTATNRHS